MAAAMELAPAMSVFQIWARTSSNEKRIRSQLTMGVILGRMSVRRNHKASIFRGLVTSNSLIRNLIVISRGINRFTISEGGSCHNWCLSKLILNCGYETGGKNRMEKKYTRHFFSWNVIFRTGCRSSRPEDYRCNECNARKMGFPFNRRNMCNTIVIIRTRETSLWSLESISQVFYRMFACYSFSHVI